MFGTLRPDSLEGCARGHYHKSFCGACHSLAGWGKLWSLGTSYDIAFLHLLMATLSEARVEARPCTALPFKKVDVMLLAPELRRALGALHILLVREKCRDDLADEKSLRGRLGLKFTDRRQVEATEVLRNAGFPVEVLSTLAERQAKVESTGGLSLEEYAGPSTLLTGEIFAWAAAACGRPTLQGRLRHLGQALGCLIYWKDAQTDQAADSRTGRFNAVTAAGARRLQPCLEREYFRARSVLESLEIEVAARLMLLTLLDNLAPTPVLSSPPRPKDRWARAGVCDDVLLGCCVQMACEGACSGVQCGLADCCSAATSGHSPEPPASEPARPASPRLPCPACSNNLTEVRHGNVLLDECPVCQGIWLDKGELEALADKTHELPARLLKPRSKTALRVRPEGTRPCPRCSRLLQGQLVRGVRLDLCPDCRGLWLDQGELNQLLS